MDKVVQMQESNGKMERADGVECQNRYEWVPVAKRGVELDDHLLLLLRDVPPLEIRPQVVDPSQPAALPAPQQPCRSKIGQKSLSAYWQKQRTNLQLLKNFLLIFPLNNQVN